MANFSGTLSTNKIFSAIYNMIISQEVFADNIKGCYSSLVDRFKVDGGLLGDTKLYYATDALQSQPWTYDSEAANLLQLARPAAPKCQKITLDQFRQIRLTVDNYLTKQAWGTEGAFASFNSVMLGWIGETKKIYDTTLFNAYIGTTKTATGKQTKTITLPAGATEADNRLEAETIAQAVADIMVEMKDVGRDYNDLSYLRSYDPSDLIVVWNSKYSNKIHKVDLPTIFHADGLMGGVDEEVLPSRYFGNVNASSGTSGSTNTTVRSLVEKTFGSKHCFPGDLLPNSTAYGAGETYTESDKVICKIVHKRSIPYMSAFSVSTSFFNPRSLTETNYLTFGYNKPEYLQNYPLITLLAA